MKFQFLLVVLVSVCHNILAQPNERHAKQGFKMKLKLDNRGEFGYVAYPGSNVSRDSIGLEYPVGRRIEHIYGGGVWVAGLVDTSAVPGSRPRIKAVSTAYEGWIGPLNEFFPGSSQADSFWTGRKNQPVVPPGWDQYWEGGVNYKPISDQDLYCRYDDDNRRPADHVPMGIRIIQSSYAWDDPYAEAIMIMEYKIINKSNRSIDSAYVGFFVDADVGPVSISGFEDRNFTGYYQDSRTAYIHNPEHRGSTPIGVSLLYPKREDVRKYTFQWYPGRQSPAPDAQRYDLMADGGIEPDEFPSQSDTRFLFAFGPFTIRAATDPLRDTLRIAVGLVSGNDLFEMNRNANRAVDIYENQGIQLPSTPPSPPLRVEAGFRRVKLDWKFRPGDKERFGRDDPETNWDTASVVARWDPMRFVSRPGFVVPAGIDSMQGGRNFEAYRIWRSENPNFPDESFTLLKQVDVVETIDSARFEYDTGLQYEFIDSNLVRGKTYVYSVTSKSIPNVVYRTLVSSTGETTRVRLDIEPLESAKRTNAVRIDLPFGVSTKFGKVSVVPNPYRTDQDYKLENGGYEGLTAEWKETDRRVKFINLPDKCTIRVFSLAGDLVRTIEHDGGGGAFPRGDRDMLLVSESNRALASGIYIFTVESTLGVQTGKFVIIR
jgi:hypothetical protein